MLSKSTFLWEDLVRLESLGCTKRVNFNPHIVNSCSVVHSKKWRCVLDASICLNKYCLRRRTKLADLSSIPLLLRTWDYITFNDLDSVRRQFFHLTKHTWDFTMSIQMALLIIGFGL